MADIDGRTLVTIRLGLHERRVGDKVFVLAANSTMHVLDNPVAVSIWDVIGAGPDDGTTVEAIAAAIHSDYEVAESQAVTDVLAFVRLLHERGVVALVQGTAD